MCLLLTSLSQSVPIEDGKGEKIFSIRIGIGTGGTAHKFAIIKTIPWRKNILAHGIIVLWLNKRH